MLDTDKKAKLNYIFYVAAPREILDMTDKKQWVVPLK